MRFGLAAGAAAIGLMVSSLAFADGAQDMGAGAMNRGGPYDFQGGKAIYTNVCQGCHMPDAKGAVGAGMYPALASNPKLETAGYPVSVIINGQKAMPPLGPYFNDTQIADVVNYIRTHFGNHYADKVTAAQVKTMR